MPNDFYPQDITADETALGFRLLMFEGFGLPDGRIYPVPVPVVAKLLDASDMLVKRKENGQVYYSHQRYGRDAEFKDADVRPDWSPMLDLNPDARRAIMDFERGLHRSAYGGKLIGVPYKLLQI